MKPFINYASLFAKHGANITFRLLMAFVLVLAASTQFAGLVQILPHVAAIVLAIYVFTHSFTGKRAEVFKGLAGTTQVDLFNPTQLQKKDIVISAIYNHYGWIRGNDNKWVKGKSAGRELPDISDDLRIVRHDLYANQTLTVGTQTFDFFLQQGPGGSIESNFDFATLPPNKMFIFFGIVAELATAASAVDTSDILLFLTPTLVADAPVLNSQVTFKINAKETITRCPFKSLFVNDDAVKGFHRFETPIAWEPGGQIQLTVKLAKAYGAGVFRNLRITLPAIELTV